MRTTIHEALADVAYPAHRRALVAHAQSNREPDEVVNAIHRLPDREFLSAGQVDEAIVEAASNKERVWQVLDSPTPPVDSLGPHTDYERVVLAWAKRHSLDIDELLARLDQTMAPLAHRLAAALRADAFKRATFAHALTRPLSGE